MQVDVVRHDDRSKGAYSGDEGIVLNSWHEQPKHKLTRVSPRFSPVDEEAHAHDEDHGAEHTLELADAPVVEQEEGERV
eukprot:CAMPEP_0167828142 /NCGR_PEP_ID=MMETSP0112_2-20121227/11202_1 /TAXON_ID=91324 /ORGANISM="Lotharella globosa, Strain CCCM811" /LENGTH=78 /DNA_ID=CAMNT_0007731217 /DNA_START=1220 /DNA_END=1456 /DNA_ORIENTATION=-